MKSTDRAEKMNIRSVLVILLCLAAAALVSYCSNDDEDAFDEWRQRFQRSYESTAEQAYRLSVFKSNRQVVLNCNAAYASGKSTFHCRLNQFSTSLFL